MKRKYIIVQHGNVFNVFLETPWHECIKNDIYENLKNEKITMKTKKSKSHVRSQLKKTNSDYS